MVDIKRQDAQKFFRDLPGPYSVFLVCGSDTGLVSEQCAKIIASIGGSKASHLEVFRIDGDALATDEKRLADEVLSISLFGDKRIIWISAGSKNFTKSLAHILSLDEIENKVLVEAGQLKADSALKKLCSRSNKAAVLDCWPDGPREISILIDEELSKQNMQISASGRALLVNSLGGDRLLTRSELEKLLLYCHGGRTVDEGDVVDIVSDAASWNFDEVIFSAFDGTRTGVSEKVEIAFRHTEANALLSLATAHCMNLLSARLEIENGKSAEQALERFPRLFGSRRSAVSAQLRKWSASALSLQLQRLQEALGNIRREPRLQREIVSRVLLNVAYSAGR